jgi:glycosyltransferase involved in cell wall biosynthesis
MIDIVITAWKREQMTEYCINALRLNTQTPCRLIVVDNGSCPWLQQMLLKNVDIYIKLDHNYGLEHAKHIGMEFVESPLFISMDNDILVYKYDPDWLSQLVGLMEKYPDYGAIALRPQILVGTGNIFEGVKEDVLPFGHVPGYARIMRTTLTKAVGAWSDKRPLRGHEEYWIGDKFAEHGWKMGWATNIKCWHMFGDYNDWGYKNMTPEEHGHTPISSLPADDRREIEKGVGITIV